MKYSLVEQSGKPPRLFRAGGFSCFWGIVGQMKCPAGEQETTEDPSLIKFTDTGGDWVSIRLVEMEGDNAVSQD